MQLAMNDTVEKQNQYASHLEHFDIIAGEAFVHGMRDIGYKDNASAINELIDNAIEQSWGGECLGPLRLWAEFHSQA